MSDVDEVREIHTSEGCKVTIKSKRGTDTRDQDEITVECSRMDPDHYEIVAMEAAAAADVAMSERRPDEEQDS
jgi:hypothetical protein